MSDAVKTDWTSMPETQLFTRDGTKKKKKGKGFKRKGVYTPWDPPADDPNLSVDGVRPPKAPSSVGPGIAGSTNTNPGGYSPATSSTKTNQVGDYQNTISTAEQNAAKGSLAARFGNAAIPNMGDDPYSVYNEYFMGRGLPGDSNTLLTALDIWNPNEKMYGMLGTKGFSSDIEAINFGQALLDQMSVGKGSQLDGIEMVKVAMQALAEEFKHPGGQQGAPLNMLGMIAHDPDPRSQLNSIKGIIQGILQGTMPDESIAGLMDQITRAASSFVSTYNTSADIGELEKGGQNIATAILNFLEGF